MDAKLAHLQRRLNLAWVTEPQRCKTEGLPKSVKGLDEWQIACLAVALEVE